MPAIRDGIADNADFKITKADGTVDYIKIPLSGYYRHDDSGADITFVDIADEAGNHEIESRALRALPVCMNKVSESAMGAIWKHFFRAGGSILRNQAFWKLCHCDSAVFAVTASVSNFAIMRFWNHFFVGDGSKS